MQEKTKPIYLFITRDSSEKHTPIYDSSSSIPTNCFNTGYEYGKYFDIKGKHLVFYCDQINTEKDEKYLRGNDVLVTAGPNRFIFVKDRIMNCLKHLMDKDIQVIPAKIHTKNGVVEGYHLINILNTVHGIDKKKSTYKKSNDGSQCFDEIFVKDEDFMEEHEMACEDELKSNIYIIPELREKILKSKIGALTGLNLVTTHRTEESRHIYLLLVGNIGKYSPSYDNNLSIPSSSYWDVGYGRGKPVDVTGKKLVFDFRNNIKTEADEKRLREYDIFCGEPGEFMFINNNLMNCLAHLVGKDIEVLPAEVYIKDRLVDGYHLINVISTVNGIDHERSTYCEATGYLDKLVPKNEDFMEGHEIAREKEIGYVYIIPALCEKLIKSKKGKLKGLEFRTAKEHWDGCHNTESCPY